MTAEWHLVVYVPKRIAHAGDQSTFWNAAGDERLSEHSPVWLALPQLPVLTLSTSSR